MRGLLTIAMREVVERRMLLALALAFGLLSLLLPILPFFRESGTVQESRDLIAWVIAVGYSATLAVMIGASVIGRDLSEGRLGFFFSRPVSGLALWAGKFAGAFLLAVGGGILALLPATVLGGGLLAPLFQVGPDYSIGLARLEGIWLYLVLAALLLFLLAAAHSVSIVIRSRSAWVVLDLAALCTSALVLLLIGRFLLLRWAAMHAARLTGWLMAGLLVSLLVAGAVQVCAGRTDVRRGHRALSLALWTCVALCLGAIGLSASWYLRVSPTKLRRVWVTRPAQGDWISLSGAAHGEGDDFSATFLLNVRTGATVDLRRPAWDSVEFSPDGRAACWVSPTGWPWKPMLEVVTAELGTEAPAPRPTGIFVEGPLMALLLSPHGERFAYADGRAVSILDTRTLKSAASFHLPVKSEGHWWVRGHFMTPGLLRLYLAENDESRKPRTTLTILEFDLSTGKLLTTGLVESESVQWVKLHPQSDRLLFRSVREGGGYDYSLWEGRTGARVASLAPGAEGGFTRTQFLSDGRVILAEEKGGHAVLTLFGSDGRPQRTVDLGEGRRPLLGAELSPGLLAVSVRPPGESAWNAGPETDEPRALLLVDLATGQVRQDRGTAGLASVFVTHYWASDVGAMDVPGTALSRLFLERDGEGSTLLELDPVKETRRIIFRTQS